MDTLAARTKKATGIADAIVGIGTIYFGFYSTQHYAILGIWVIFVGVLLTVSGYLILRRK